MVKMALCHDARGDLWLHRTKGYIYKNIVIIIAEIKIKGYDITAIT